MILYNVTVKIDKTIENEWVAWMKSTHIPEVLQTNIFTEHKFCKILFPVDEDDGQTYAIQYFCNSMDDLEEYQAKFAKKLQEKHSTKYKNRFVAIRTLMEIL